MGRRPGRTCVAATLIALCAAPAAHAGWRGAPVAPTIRGEVLRASLQTLERGEELGNRRGVFAKVGDSITESGSFLQDAACQAPRWGRWRGLRSTRAFFGRTELPAGYTGVWCGRSNSFSRASLAAVAGWTAADPLGPLSHPGCSGALAHPLECELTLLRPSVALIMYGTNDLEAGPVRRFKRNLGRVVERTRALGVIPVLSTIPPRADTSAHAARAGVFNRAIAAVARGRHVALWNYWRQMARGGTVGQGLDSDGVHPSLTCPPCNSLDFTAVGLRQGYAQRNLGALRALQRVRGRVLARG